MESQVSVNAKKVFIRWVLKTHQFRRREVVWILNYMMSHESYLENAIFVDKASEHPRGMEMTTTDSSGLSFRFHKDTVYTNDAEKAFHDLRLNNAEPMYIQINFPNKYQETKYWAVLEDYNSSSEISPANIEMVDEIVAELEKRNILKAIDAALDSGDEKLFVELCEMLNEVGQKKTLSFSG